MLEIKLATFRDGSCPRLAVSADFDETASLQGASGDPMLETFVIDASRSIIGDPLQHGELNFVERLVHAIQSSDGGLHRRGSRLLHRQVHELSTGRRADFTAENYSDVVRCCSNVPRSAPKRAQNALWGAKLRKVGTDALHRFQALRRAPSPHQCPDPLVDCQSTNRAPV